MPRKARLLTILLSFALFAYCENVPVVQPKKFGLYEPDNKEAVDSLLETIAPYLAKPMSWCKVTPTGISSSKPIGGKSYNAYKSLNVHLDVHCDNKQSLGAGIAAFTGGYKYDMKRMQPVGILWKGQNGAYLNHEIKRRFPAILYNWSQSETEVKIFVPNEYGGQNQGSPIFGTISLNGIMLSDQFIYDHASKYEHSQTNSIFRLMVETCYVMRVVVETPKAPRANILNKQEYSVSDYKATVSYLIDSSTVNQIISEPKHDIQINRIYNLETPGSMNRSYKFLGYLD